MKTFSLILIPLMWLNICFGQTYDQLSIQLPESYKFRIDTTFSDLEGNHYTLLSSNRFNIKGGIVMEILVKKITTTRKISDEAFFDSMETYYNGIEASSFYENINRKKYILSGTTYDSEHDPNTLMYLLVAHTINNNTVYTFHIRTNVDAALGWLDNLLNEIIYRSGK
jgi:hypothetical protein